MMPTLRATIDSPKNSAPLFSHRKSLLGGGGAEDSEPKCRRALKAWEQGRAEEFEVRGPLRDLGKRELLL